jgi:hypothetical protein
VALKKIIAQKTGKINTDFKEIIRKRAMKQKNVKDTVKEEQLKLTDGLGVLESRELKMWF